MIRRCDMQRPYVFISYSSADIEIVKRDVAAFQERGLNFWFDEKNLDHSLDSWSDSALQAIRSENCSLVVFYLSRASASSQNCLKELLEMSSEEALENHRGPVPFIVVETQRTEDIGTCCKEWSDQFMAAGEPDRARAVRDFYYQILRGSNTKCRIHPAEEGEKPEEYYDRVSSYFPDYTMHARNRMRYLVPFYLECGFEEGCRHFDEDPAWARLPDAGFGDPGSDRQERDIWPFLLRAFSASPDYEGQRLGAIWKRKAEGPLLQLAYFDKGTRDRFREILIGEAGLVLFESGVGIFWYEASFGRTCERGERIGDVPGRRGKGVPEPISLTRVMDFQNRFKELARYKGSRRERLFLMKTGSGLVKNAGRKKALPDIAAACEESLTFETVYEEEGRKMLNRTRFYAFAMGRWVCACIQGDRGGLPLRFFTEREYPLQSREEESGKEPVFRHPIPDKAIFFQYIVTGRIGERSLKTAAAYLTCGYDGKYRLDPDRADFLWPFEKACWYARSEGCGYYVTPSEHNADYYDNQMYGTVTGDYFLIYLLVLYQVYTMRRFLIRLYEAKAGDSGGSEALLSDMRSFLRLNSFASVSSIQNQDAFFAYLEKALNKKEQMEQIRSLCRLMADQNMLQ